MSFRSTIISESFSRAKPISIDVVAKTLEFFAQDNPEAVSFLKDKDVDQIKFHLNKEILAFFYGCEQNQVQGVFEEILEKWTTLNIDEKYLHMGLDAFQKSLAYFFGEDWDGELSQAWTDAAAEFLEHMNLKGEEKKMVDYKKIPNQTIIPGAPTVLPSGNEGNIASGPKFKPADEEANIIPSIPPEPIPESSKEEKLAKIQKERETIAAGKPPIPEGEVEKADEMESEEAPSTLMQSIIENSKEEIHSGGNYDEIKIEGLGSIKFDSLELPKGLMNSIQKAAEEIVKKTIQKELESALENELKKYLEKGIGDFLKKSS